VERCRKIETVGATIPRDLKEIRVKILVVASTKILRKLRETFGELVGFLELLNSATGGEGCEHQFTIVDIRIERRSIATDISKMGGMSSPWGDTVTDGAENCRLTV
jgi:hypothetical protein